MPNEKYIIGTRGSLLALTQCGQIKDQLEELTGDSFQLKVIKTQGDLQTEKPLWQMDGKDFFTKELDTALINGEVDLVVHSYKDLGSERPLGIGLAAVTKRKFAHDILLIKNQTIKNINEKEDFIVGTSSPRRIVNIEKSLTDFLPSKKALNVKTQMLRGNVNTRIQKLRDGDYDAIVLALPGIDRLAITKSSKVELEKLLTDLNYLILPQSIFPAAASQGALGIEYHTKRSDNGVLLEKLKKLEDKTTVSEVSRERQAFNSYGGGCHLAVGINVFKQGDYHLHVHKGISKEKTVDETLLEGAFASPTNKGKYFFIGLAEHKIKDLKLDSNQYFGDLYINKVSVGPKDQNQLASKKHLYVTSNYCIPATKELPHDCGLFASGVKTMKALIKEGYWVNATADSRGDEYLQNILESTALQIMHKNHTGETLVLTNDESQSILGETLTAYKRVINEQLDLEALKNKLFKTEIFFWTSFYQYKTYLELYPELESKFHCTGIGKTYKLFKENKISVRPFSNIKEFIKFTQKL